MPNTDNRLIEKGLNSEMGCVLFEVLNHLQPGYVGRMIGWIGQVWQSRVLLDCVQVEPVVMVAPGEANVFAGFEHYKRQLPMG